MICEKAFPTDPKIDSILADYSGEASTVTVSWSDDPRHGNRIGVYRFVGDRTVPKGFGDVDEERYFALVVFRCLSQLDINPLTDNPHNNCRRKEVLSSLYRFLC